MEAPGGRRVEQRQRRVAEPGQPALHARDELVGEVVGGGQDGDREPHVAAAARERHLRAR